LRVEFISGCLDMAVGVDFTDEIEEFLLKVDDCLFWRTSLGLLN